MKDLKCVFFEATYVLLLEKLNRMNDKLHQLIIKKDKLLKEIEIVYEQIALERIMTNENDLQNKKKMEFEINTRNKFRIK
ncbi:hypothetical protein [Chryseobacterium sp.]|uniref:hypothetical protein n=1 Tax=Chryseobacterium sp. TaxID=1871047 RepID=UPI0024E24ABD|nr:hypothetical protein [Chryseobacterium sp.]